MIPTGGRTDVMVQWFSDEFIKSHDKMFERMTVGPGEVLMIVKDGKPSDIYTESTVKLAGDGFLAKFREKLRGTRNQVIMADLRPFAVKMAITGYTKDRTAINGTISATVRVSKENMGRLSNLYIRDLVTDAKWGVMSGKIKEVTQEDIQKMMAYDSALTVDTSVLSTVMSSEIRDDFDRFNARVRNALDTMTPVWANCGLAVDVAKVDLDESTNAYEEAMRYRDQQTKAQMKMDADYETRAHKEGWNYDISILIAKKNAELELQKAVGDYDVREFKFTREMEEELARTDQDIEVRRRKMASELEFAKTQADIDRINGVSDNEVRRRKADTDAYVEMAKIRNEEYVKDQDVRRQIELMQAKKQLEIDKAFADGEANGKKMAEETMFQSGYDRGYADGLKEAMRNGTHQTVVMPGYGAPGYGYPPAPPYGYDDRRRDEDGSEDRRRSRRDGE